MRGWKAYPNSASAPPKSTAKRTRAALRRRGFDGTRGGGASISACSRGRTDGPTDAICIISAMISSWGSESRDAEISASASTSSGAIVGRDDGLTSGRSPLSAMGYSPLKPRRWSLAGTTGVGREQNEGASGGKKEATDRARACCDASLMTEPPPSEGRRVRGAASVVL